MNTRNVFRMLTVMIVLVATQFSAYAKQDNNIVYNALERNGVLVGQTIYKKEGSNLAQVARYNYVYDQNKRIVENNISRWNKEDQVWENSISVQYRYKGQNITTKYYAWDNETNTYQLIPRLSSTIKDSNL